MRNPDGIILARGLRDECDEVVHLGGRDLVRGPVLGIDLATGRDETVTVNVYRTPCGRLLIGTTDT